MEKWIEDLVPTKRLSREEVEKARLAGEILKFWLRKTYNPPDEWYGSKFNELVDMSMIKLKALRGVCKGQY